jgi:5-hydroxyisourate hydrolase
MSISTHVLDAVSGRPAAGLSVALLDADYLVCDVAVTDDDGRIAELGHRGPAGGAYATAQPGLHRLRFGTGAYFAARGIETFYPEVTITFEVTDPAGKYHVPLLLSPYSYSTYRGS